jgi:hypothetical protein
MPTDAAPRSYAEANALLTPTGGTLLRLAPNTNLFAHADGSLGVQFYQTCIVAWYPDGTVTFNTGGYNTVTTRERLNRYAPEGTRFYSRDRVLYMTRGDGLLNPVKVSDGMRYNPRTGAVTHRNRPAAEAPTRERLVPIGPGMGRERRLVEIDNHPAAETAFTPPTP